MILTNLFGELDDKSFELPSKLVLSLLVVFLLSSQFSYALPDRICYPLTGGTVCINGTTTFGGSDTDTWWPLTGLYLFNNSGSLDLNETKLNATIAALATGTSDGNNYTNNITVTGTSTKNITLGIIGRPQISAVFTDIDTDTDTWWNISGSAYFYNCSGILCLNETKLNNTIDNKISGLVNITTVNSLYNYSGDVSALKASNTSLNASLTAEILARQSLGNWSQDKSAIQANITNVNATANLKALPGSCTGQVVSATTTSGVTCVDYVNKTTTDGLYQIGSEQNNYTTSIGFNNTGLTFQLNLARNGMINLSATFTTTDTGNCSVDQSCPNILYDTNASNFYSSSNPLNFINGTYANATYINITTGASYQTGTEQNNYTQALVFNATGSTAQITIGILGRTNLSASLLMNDTSRAYPGTCTGQTAIQVLSATASPTCIGFGTSNLTLSDITSSIGNWSLDKSAIQANITNVNATANTKALPSTCSGQTAVQTTSSSTAGTCIGFGTSNLTLSDITSSIGNWSLNASQVWSNISALAINISNVNATANLKALPGDCPSGEFVQNTTTSGVECSAPAGGGTVTSIAFNASGLLGGTITSSGSVDLNYSYLNLLYNDTGIINGLDITDLGWVNDWMIAYSDNSGLQELAFGSSSGKFLMSNGEAAPTWETIVDSWWNISGSEYFYNCSGVLCLNETTLNATIHDYVNAYYNYSGDVSALKASNTSLNASLTAEILARISIGNWSLNASQVWSNISALGSNISSLISSNTTLSGRVDAVNASDISRGNWSQDKPNYINQTYANATYINITTGASYQTGTEQNNYTQSIGFNVTGSTVQLNLNRTGMINLTATFTQNITGSGTDGKVAMWTGTSILGTDSLYMNSSLNQLCINCTSASGLSQILTVNGNINITGSSACIYFPNGGRIGSACG